MAIELKEIKDSDELFVVKSLCGDCGVELDRTRPLTGKKIWSDWVLICTGDVLRNSRCPKGCRATFSDCNANTRLEIGHASVPQKASSG